MVLLGSNYANFSKIKSNYKNFFWILKIIKISLKFVIV